MRVETEPSVWEDSIQTHNYYGDILRNNSRWENSGNVNDDLNVNVQISILADPYIYTNFQNIKFVEWMGARWKVTTIEPQYPRLLLSLGGVYNGPDPEEV